MMPRWEMEVKCDVSEPVGERMPAGRFSFKSARSSRDGVLLELSVRVIAAARLLFGGASPLPVGKLGEGEWLTIVGIEAGGGIRYAPLAPGVSEEGSAVC